MLGGKYEKCDKCDKFDKYDKCDKYDKYDKWKDDQVRTAWLKELLPMKIRKGHQFSEEGGDKKRNRTEKIQVEDLFVL